MKKLFLPLLSIFSSTLLWSQTAITNGNLETWQNVGSNTEEPTQFNSNKTGGGYATSGPQTCFRETSNPHSGSYCAKVMTAQVPIIGTIVNGSLTTGKVQAPTTNKAEGFIESIPNDPNYRMTFTGRPDSFVFWYRYTKAGSDYPTVQARLHVSTCQAPEIPVGGNHALDTNNIVARALWQGAASTVSNWTRVSVPFDYRNSTTPAYILITTTSSGNQTGGANGSTLWLDDFEAIYNPTIATGTISPLTYYVSATGGAPITVPFTLTGTYNAGNTITAQLSDASGSFVSPVTLGSLTTTASGSISGTIPANTPAGTQYRVRVVSNNPALTANANTSDITIVVAGNSIASSATQTLAANTNGTAVSVTETAGATAREWQYATIAGGPYQSFSTAETGTSYTPNFANAGTYYVVAVTTYPGGLTVTSNELQVNVVANAVTPAAPQSILVSSNGNTLTVTETPVGTAREWKYATVSGGPYQSFGTAQTGTSYTPNFASGGNYYVVAVSTISGVTVTSNEVVISVNSVTLSTGTVAGSPFEFSASAPNASVSVPFTTSGNFNGGNTFTAQLSDASGSFASPTTIGSVSAVSSGSISASIPSSTPAGTGYRIRVIASSPVVLGNDNGTDLVVDQFSNSVAPPNAQNIVFNTNGTSLAVFASQSSTQEWKYSTTSGSGYVSFNPAQTGSSYTPNFATPGTYYVVAVSTNQYSDAVTSNEVQINVANGTTITTSAVSGSPFLVSPSANVQISVNFTSTAVFNNGNTFKAELSDATGSFANAVEIGTLSGTTVGAITATIPNGSSAGTGYRIRVVSTDPAITGTDNGTDLAIVPFEVTVAPLTTQTIDKGTAGSPVTATATHNCTYLWQWTEVSGLGYTNFNPSETAATYTPQFAAASTYYVVCKLTNAATDVITSQEVTIIVQEPNGINETTGGTIKSYWNGSNFIVDLSNSTLTEATLHLVNTNGQVVLQEKLNPNAVNAIVTALPKGIYVFRINGNGNVLSGKTSKQ